VLVKINSLLPNADNQYELRIPKNVQSNTEFEYTNNKNDVKEVEFICSNPEICIIPKALQVVQSGETVKVEIVIRPGPLNDTQSMFIYAIDKNTSKTEPFLFNLIFIDI